MEASYLIWQLLIPLILSLLAFAARWLKHNTRLAVEAVHVISISTVLLTSIMIARDVRISGAQLALNGWLHVDALSAIFLLIIGAVGFLAGIYSIGYTRHDLKTGEFDLNRLTIYYGLFSLFLFTMLLAVTANNIVMMWVAIEATTLGSAFLVGIYQHRSSLEAAWKYVIICTVGVAFGLYGIVLVYSDAVNVMLQPGKAVLWTEILKNTQLLDPTMIKMAFVFILIGFGTKAGLFPMHAWLPDAHSEAPSPISALLSAVLLNCALLVILRFTVITDRVIGFGFSKTLFLIFGFLSVAAAAFFIFIQRDIKRLLAYSSMENIGLIVLAFGIGGPIAAFAGLLHTVNHSLVKALMFCASGNILMKYRSRSLDQIKGMLQVIPGTSLLLFIGSLALIGSPPFNIFISKFMIIASGLGAGHVLLMFICLLLLLVIFAAFFRMITTTIFGNKPEGMQEGEFGWLTLAPPALIAIFILLLGVYFPPPLSALLTDASYIMTMENMTLTAASSSSNAGIASIPNIQNTISAILDLMW